MSTATIGRHPHKPAAKRPPAAPPETTRKAPAASAEAAALPVDVESCATKYETVLSCTLDIEVWTSD